MLPVSVIPVVVTSLRVSAQSKCEGHTSSSSVKVISVRCESHITQVQRSYQSTVKVISGKSENRIGQEVASVKCEGHISQV